MKRIKFKYYLLKEKSRMKMGRFFKRFVSIACLGTAIGLHSMATEHSKIYQREIRAGKSHIYAEYYSKAILKSEFNMARAIIQSEIFEREYAVSKNFVRADYYAKILANEQMKKIRINNENNYNEYMSREELYKCSDESFITKYKPAQKMIKDEIKLKGKSEAYAKFYAKLRFVCGLDEKNARTQTDLYLKELTAGKSHAYAGFYSEMMTSGKINDRQARTRSEIFEKEFETGKNSYIYLRHFVDLIDNYGINKTAASIRARLFEMEFKLLGMSVNYCFEYAKLIVEDRLDEGRARKRALFVEQSMNSGKSYIYASEYARLLLELNDTCELARIKAEIYEKDIKAGRTPIQARHHACLVAVRSTMNQQEAEEYLFNGCK